MKSKNIFKNTELQLIKSISEVTKKNSNFVFFSEKFPNYYGGNGIAIFNDVFESDLMKYVDLFNDLTILNKFKISFYTVNKNNMLYDCIKRKGFEYDFVNIMKFKSRFKASIKNTHEVKLISNLLDIKNFEKEVNSNPWFWNQGFEKKIELTKKNDINWIGIYIKDKLVSCMGYFIYKNFIRLQDVETITEYQQNGYASILINFITTKFKNSHNIYLYVDLNNYRAINFYKKNGFEKKQEILEVLIKN